MNPKDFSQFVQDAFQTDEFIPLHVPIFKGNEKKYLEETIDSTFVSSVGAFVDKFEEQITNFTKVKKSVAVASGTAGLHLSLKVVGVELEDEVLTQALSFVATANAITYCGAKPVFIDVDMDTMGLSPKHLKAFLDYFAEIRSDGTYNKQTNKRIGACVPMHTFGFMSRIDEIVTICDQWNIPVIEDAAEALGSLYKNKNAGSFGQMSAFSFNGNKIITSGGGGIVCTNDESLADKAKFLSTTAKDPHKWEYFHSELGFNYRMPNLNAALALAQLEMYPTILESKKQLFSAYKKYFEGTTSLVEPPKETTWNHWLMCVQLSNIEERNEFLSTTNAAGVMTRPIWKLLYKLPMYLHCQRDDQKNANLLEDRIVNIPSSARI
tara:strand:- start:2667 stop:3806 length:1140 start_codon:yes stop_codon:yes gene_type:complete